MRKSKKKKQPTHIIWCATALEHTTKGKTTQSHGTQQIEIILIPIIDEQKNTHNTERELVRSQLFQFLSFAHLFCHSSALQFSFLHSLSLHFISFRSLLVPGYCWFVVLLAVVVSFKSFQLIKNMVSVFQDFSFDVVPGSLVFIFIHSSLHSLSLPLCSALVGCRFWDKILSLNLMHTFLYLLLYRFLLSFQLFYVVFCCCCWLSVVFFGRPSKHRPANLKCTSFDASFSLLYSLDSFCNSNAFTSNSFIFD